MASPSFSPGTRPNISVLVGPGLRAFTRIFLSASSALMVLAKMEIPALIADITVVVGQAVLTVTDELTITEERLLNREKCPLQVDGNQLVKRIFFDGFEGPELTEAGVRKDHIEMPEVSFDF